jgi:hypothetical protein
MKAKIDLIVALKRQLNVPPNLDKTFKGAAVKVFQHTQLPFDSFFMNLAG